MSLNNTLPTNIFSCKTKMLFFKNNHKPGGVFGWPVFLFELDYYGERDKRNNNGYR